VTWHFESVLNWIWHCCISTHLTFHVSQGSAATDLRWGENFYKFLSRDSLWYIAVKKLRKSVNICLSSRKNKYVSFFMAHSVYLFIYGLLSEINYMYVCINKCVDNHCTTSTRLMQCKRVWLLTAPDRTGWHRTAPGPLRYQAGNDWLFHFHDCYE